ncbi:hypothetical protein OYC64_005418 [Pagothenia borchgrevinki]|uniref:Uncharacterized protein n=1 Tax=Pagothenia borchgrevinki TaxID=8213 RepID=A0ABD2GG70_PAGBO
MLLSKSGSAPPSQLPTSNKVSVNSNPPSLPHILTQLVRMGLTERRWRGAPRPPTPKSVALVWDCTSLPPSQDTSPLYSPVLPFPAWSSEPILTLYHLSVNLKKKEMVYYIYNIYIWFSVTLYLPVLPSNDPLHCAVHRKSNLQQLSGERWRVRVSSPPLEG